MLGHIMRGNGARIAVLRGARCGLLVRPWKWATVGRGRGGGWCTYLGVKRLTLPAARGAATGLPGAACADCAATISGM
jgi:hypothetical protein